MKDIREPTSGFSLVEVLVALLLFALIGSAGFAILDQILRTQRLTEGRLEEIAALQRSMHVIRLDFEHASNTSLMLNNDTTPPTLQLRRSSASSNASEALIIYRLDNGILNRVVNSGGDQTTPQPLLEAVSNIQWRFFSNNTGWTPEWPSQDNSLPMQQETSNPAAVELTVTLEPGNETLRRVVLLPAELQ